MRLILAAILIMFLAGSATAYSVPEEFRGQAATNDVELFKLAEQHKEVQWANYILDDLGYRYNVRNYAQFQKRMEYQAKFAKIVRNNLVVENN